MGLPVDFTVNTFLNDSTSPHSKRRKFTPPTTYPLANLSATENGASDFEDHTFSSPILPQLSGQAPSRAEIEASLLQVGMRIRKSVNDGYKTTQKKFTPRPFAHNLMRLSPETQRALMNAGNAEEPEEAPFSAGGLHNVGGLAMQPLATATFCGVNLALMSWASEDHAAASAAADDVEQLWSYTTSHKRSHEAESDSEDSQDWQPQTPTLAPEDRNVMMSSVQALGGFGSIDTDGMSDISPLTHPLSGLLNQHGRRMAKPRTRTRELQVQGQTQTHTQTHTQTQSFQIGASSMMLQPSTEGTNPFAGLNMLPGSDQQQPTTIFSAQTTQTQTQTFSFDANDNNNRVEMTCGFEANLMMDFGNAPFLQRPEDVDMDCS